MAKRISTPHTHRIQRLADAATVVKQRLLPPRPFGAVALHEAPDSASAELAPRMWHTFAAINITPSASYPVQPKAAAPQPGHAFARAIQRQTGPYTSAHERHYGLSAASLNKKWSERHAEDHKKKDDFKQDGTPLYHGTNSDEAAAAIMQNGFTSTKPEFRDWGDRPGVDPTRDGYTSFSLTKEMGYKHVFKFTPDGNKNPKDMFKRYRENEVRADGNAAGTVERLQGQDPDGAATQVRSKAAKVTATRKLKQFREVLLKVHPEYRGDKLFPEVFEPGDPASSRTKKLLKK